MGDVDWIRYGPADSLIRRVSWRQAAADEVTLTFELEQPVWGYRARWDRTDLLLDIRRPPAIDAGDPLRGRLIAVDPGHPPGGAMGPTGLREADANLAVALELRRLLEGAGAQVLMTRVTDSVVELWPRVQFAEQAGRRGARVHSQQRAAGRDQSVRQQRHERLLQSAAQRAARPGRSRPRSSADSACATSASAGAIWPSSAAPGCRRC